MRATRYVFVATGLLVALAAAFFVWSAPRRSVALPGPDAKPVEVVRTYVRALNARDYSTSNAIQMLGSAVENHGWFGGPSIRNLKITDVTPVSTGADFPDSTVSKYPQVVEVATTGDFHNWGGMTDGTNSWSYYLVRTSDSQRWRIADWGQG